MPKPMLLQLNSLAVAAFVFMIIAVPPAFAQEMDDMKMNQTIMTTESPVIMTTDDGKINVKLSWEPETVDIGDQPTIFTLEFLDADTEQRISDVTIPSTWHLTARAWVMAMRQAQWAHLGQEGR